MITKKEKSHFQGVQLKSHFQGGSKGTKGSINELLKFECESLEVCWVQTKVHIQNLIALLLLFNYEVKWSEVKSLSPVWLFVTL